MDQIFVCIWNKIRWMRRYFEYNSIMFIFLYFVLLIVLILSASVVASLVAYGKCFCTIFPFSGASPVLPLPVPYVFLEQFIFFTLFILCYSCLMYFKFHRSGIFSVYGVAACFFGIVIMFLMTLRSTDWWFDVVFSDPTIPMDRQLSGAANILLWFLLLTVLFIPLLVRAYQLVVGQRINISFERALSALEKLAENKNDEIKNYKSMYEIYPVSWEYDSGIKGIKNLLTRGVDLSVFSVSNTKFDDFLDRLSLSIRYYIFYGEYEQIEAVKRHISHVDKCFDKNYNIHVNGFVKEILRMDGEMGRYFKVNDIEIIYTTKLVYRIRSRLQEILPIIIALIVAGIINYYVRTNIL